MIVDDEPDVVELIKEVLKEDDHSVIGATSGRECLELLKKERPDLILLDVMMPQMDGWEVCRKIKDDPSTSSITVAMLTIRSREEDKITSLDEGLADWHITKPVNIKKLRQTVRWLLESPLPRNRRS